MVAFLGVQLGQETQEDGVDRRSSGGLSPQEEEVPKVGGGERALAVAVVGVVAFWCQRKAKRDGVGWDGGGEE